MLIVVTGNIASGKSTACEYITKKYNFEYINTDKIAHHFLDDDDVKLAVFKALYIDGLCDTNGANVFIGGEIDRKLLGKLAFKNKKLMKVLTDIIHPKVNMVLKYMIKHFEEQNKHILLEHSVLFEYGQEHNYDNIILITCPYSMRIDRLMKRNNLSREEATERIEAQFPQYDKMVWCFTNNHVVIETDNIISNLEINLDAVIDNIIKTEVKLEKRD